MPSKKVAIICGCGVATSTVVRMKLDQLFKTNKLDVTISTGSAPEAATITHGADLIIAITPMPRDFGIPVINGVPFISGVGEEETAQKIVLALSQG